MSKEPDFLSEDEARRLWQRAAQLQADQARLAEARAAGDAEAELHGGEAGRSSDGYALTHVRAAALEAGIGGEFVDAALGEVRAEKAMGSAADSSRHVIARLILGNPADTVTTRRTILATPEEVLSAMEAIVPHEPYTLLLRERLGDPARGGTLVFDLDGVGFSKAGQAGFKGDASYGDLRQVYVTVTPLPGSPVRTEVTMASPIAWALSINAAVSGALSLLGGGLGSAVGVGLAVVTVLGPVGGGILAATGFGAGGSGALGLFRYLYRYGQGRGVRALETLLATVASKAEGGWGIAPRSEPPVGGTLPPV